ncbi:MAG: LexA family transcriptional regulator [Clostridia bacterium]|nr:LexA family transcriptional regulator [Clostridia bacterium]
MLNLIEFGKRIKGKRLALKMTQEELAKKTGYTSRSSINKIELGLVDLPQSKILSIANALETTPAYLMGWELDSTPSPDITTVPGIFIPKKKRLPVLGNIACGEPVFAEESFDGYIEIEDCINADFCLRAKGDSMIGARIMDGDIVIVKKQDMVRNGEIAVVLIDDEATLKRAYFYPDKNKLVLNPENPKYEPLVYIGEELNSIHILGKAVAFQSVIR